MMAAIWRMYNEADPTAIVLLLFIVSVGALISFGSV
jgi:hypothetical protein